jgi:hypothetical protein
MIDLAWWLTRPSDDVYGVIGGGSTPDHNQPNQHNPIRPVSVAGPSLMITTTTALVLWKLIAVLLILVAVIDLLTMSQHRRIRLHYHQGLSQQSIADRLGVTRYQVRTALAN